MNLINNINILDCTGNERMISLSIYLYHWKYIKNNIVEMWIKKGKAKNEISLIRYEFKTK